MSSFVATRSEHGVVTVEIAGAKGLNILGSAAIAELTACFAALPAHPGLRVVVLRGAGEKAFIGGADIAEMATLDRASAETFIRGLAGLCEAIRECPVPVIARLSGWCLGGGLEVAICCDLRVAGENARFGLPEVAVGIPSVIHSALLPALIGSARAGWLVLTGATIDAVRAEQWGLVHELVADEALDARIDELAGTLASYGPQVVRQQKRLLGSWIDKDVRTAIADSVEQFGLAYLTGEPQAAMGRFLTRRTGP